MPCFFRVLQVSWMVKLSGRISHPPIRNHKTSVTKLYGQAIYESTFVSLTREKPFSGLPHIFSRWVSMSWWLCSYGMFSHTFPINRGTVPIILQALRNLSVHRRGQHAIILAKQKLWEIATPSTICHIAIFHPRKLCKCFQKRRNCTFSINF